MHGIERGMRRMSLGYRQTCVLNHKCSSVIIHRAIYLFSGLFHMCVTVENVFKNKKIREKYMHISYNEDLKCVHILGKNLLYLHFFIISLLKNNIRQHILLLNSGCNQFHWGKDKDPLLKE